jgi:hypothetical protein
VFHLFQTKTLHSIFIGLSSMVSREIFKDKYLFSLTVNDLMPNDGEAK